MAGSSRDTGQVSARVARSRRLASLRRQQASSAASGELGACLHDVVGAVAREFGADAVSVWLREPKDVVRCVYHNPGRLSPGSASAALQDEYRLDRTSFLYCLAQTRWPVALRHCASNPVLGQAREWVSAAGVGTILLIPISPPIGDEAENVGWCLLFHRQDKEFGPGDIDRATMRGRQLGFAIHAARAALEGKHSAIADERKRIARELHDTLVQGFTSILLQIERGRALLGGRERDALAALDRARDLARECLAEARRAIRAMRPRALGESDLPTALESLLRNMAAGSGVATEFKLRGPVPPLTVAVEMNLLAIMQEAVANALHHARARAIRVRLASDDEFVKLSVEDDGRGFLLADARSGGGFGLISMRERAETLSGKLVISSHPARGTRILAKIPIASS